MSSLEKFPHILQMILVGLLTGFIFIYSRPLAGGKLGCIAFGAAVTVKEVFALFEIGKAKWVGKEK